MLRKIKFPVHGGADRLQNRLIVSHFPGVDEEHRAEEDSPDDVELALDLLLIPAGLGEKLRLHLLAAAGHLPPGLMVEIVEFRVLEHQDGPEPGLLHQKTQIPHHDQHDLLPQSAAAVDQNLLLPLVPLLVDELDDGGDEFPLILEMLIGCSAAHAAFLGHPADGKLRHAHPVDLLDTRLDQKLAHIPRSFRHRRPPFPAGAYPPYRIGQLYHPPERESILFFTFQRNTGKSLPSDTGTQTPE